MFQSSIYLQLILKIIYTILPIKNFSNRKIGQIFNIKYLYYAVKFTHSIRSEKETKRFIFFIVLFL
jgi:hypothetical protein